MNKLTQGEVGQCIMQAAKDKQEYPCLRMGQSIFNATARYYPEAIIRIVGTGADCFFNDNKIQAFIDAISN